MDHERLGIPTAIDSCPSVLGLFISASRETPRLRQSRPSRIKLPRCLVRQNVPLLVQRDRPAVREARLGSSAAAAGRMRSALVFGGVGGLFG